jgi:hypothetical protein
VSRGRVVAAWAAGWALMSAALWSGGLFNSTREPYFAATVVVAAAGWVLPALTLRRAGESAWPTLAIWGLSFLAAAWVGETLAWRFERSGSFGALGFVVGAGVGGGIGHLGRAALDWTEGRGPSKFFRSVVAAILGFLAFAAGSYLAIVGSYLLGEMVKRLLEPLWGWRPGLVLGIALGGALGGTLAGVASAAAISPTSSRKAPGVTSS